MKIINNRINKLYKINNKKAVVLLITMIFLTSIFIPAVTSQKDYRQINNSDENNIIKNVNEILKKEINNEKNYLINSDKTSFDIKDNLDLLTLKTLTNNFWWNAQWQYRKNITIDYTKVSADLSNFPVLIDITDTNLW